MHTQETNSEYAHPECTHTRLLNAIPALPCPAPVLFPPPLLAAEHSLSLRSPGFQGPWGHKLWLERSFGPQGRQIVASGGFTPKPSQAPYVRSLFVAIRKMLAILPELQRIQKERHVKRVPLIGQDLESDVNSLIFVYDSFEVCGQGDVTAFNRTFVFFAEIPQSFFWLFFNTSFLFLELPKTNSLG